MQYVIKFSNGEYAKSYYNEQNHEYDFSSYPLQEAEVFPLHKATFLKGLIESKSGVIVTNRHEKVTVEGVLEVKIETLK